MVCEFCEICRRGAALKQIQVANEFTPQEYPLTELKEDVCDNPDEAQRSEICPAFIDIRANGRASTWAK